MRTNTFAAPQQDPNALRAASIAPRPVTIADTGLSLDFLAELIEKLLHNNGVQTRPALAKCSALAGPILEDVLGFLRNEARIETRGPAGVELGLRYALTDKGRQSAQAAFARSGYAGPAPVPLGMYTELARAQSTRERVIGRERMHAAFADVVLDPTTLDRLGPAVNSGKAIFVYGEPGTGKTYITQRLSRLLDDAVLIPHAVCTGQTVIRVFDQAVHIPVGTVNSGLLLDEGYDPRLVLCRRPLLFTGGDLVPEMLEVQFDADTRSLRAPLQMKAMNGMLIIDDLGRQSVPPQQLLNRWIVPMEDGRDFLRLANGEHLCVPFDMLLVFSTIMNPAELADAAFLRRIGYKIRFEPLTPAEYHEIWKQVCVQCGIEYDADICQGVIDGLHTPAQVPQLPCHPRDLIGMALDHAAYFGGTGELRLQTLEWAWNNYFVKLDNLS
jgi:hypothetical protein